MKKGHPCTCTLHLRTYCANPAPHTPRPKHAFGQWRVGALRSEAGRLLHRSTQGRTGLSRTCIESDTEEADSRSLADVWDADSGFALGTVLVSGQPSPQSPQRDWYFIVGHPAAAHTSESHHCFPHRPSLLPTSTQTNPNGVCTSCYKPRVWDRARERSVLRPASTLAHTEQVCYPSARNRIQTGCVPRGTNPEFGTDLVTALRLASKHSRPLRPSFLPISTKVVPNGGCTRHSSNASRVAGLAPRPLARPVPDQAKQCTPRRRTPRPPQSNSYHVWAWRICEGVTRNQWECRAKSRNHQKSGKRSGEISEKVGRRSGEGWGRACCCNLFRSFVN